MKNHATKFWIGNGRCLDWEGKGSLAASFGGYRDGMGMEVDKMKMIGSLLVFLEFLKMSFRVD